MDSGRFHDDLEPWWLPVEPERQSVDLRARRRGAGTQILAAAMFGLADAIGHERPRDDTVQVADAPIGNGDLPLDFGRLDPLE